MLNEDKLNPELVKKAKERAAGPEGEQMAKFPLRFASFVCYGRVPKKDSKPCIKNGTASIIDFGNGPIIVTAQHVIQCYRDWLKKEKDLIFQIGGLKIDPLARIISESPKYDLVTIKIKEEERKKIAPTGEIGKDVFYAAQWPPNLPTDKDWVVFGGFPGKWRQCISSNEFSASSDLMYVSLAKHIQESGVIVN